MKKKEYRMWSLKCKVEAMARDQFILQSYV